ncbi:hypothetical protein ACFPVT_02060 [Corynebacterium choanae]|uniref:Uncharacterized protein n=1 Tax=Corynebacterium choanae TaxID=1862358 RepID=A0A3G6J885_9CORY|nr:hypothetical protein [Corynebacterium choanae]AZA12660.1 hypothetical protein CCHOA_01160 [Corynebacterium choanae]
MHPKLAIDATKLFVALVGLVALLLAAIGISSRAGDLPPWPSFSGSGTTRGPVTRDSDLAANPQIENPHQTTWDGYEIIGDGSQIRVFFTTGTHRCYGINTAVTQTPTQVKITVFQGRLPDAPMACTRELVVTSTVVDLDQPLGARMVTQ